MNIKKFKKELFKNPKVRDAYIKLKIKELRKKLDKENQYCLDCNVGAVYPNYGYYVDELLRILSV